MFIVYSHPWAFEETKTDICVGHLSIQNTQGRMNVSPRTSEPVLPRDHHNDKIYLNLFWLKK